jgi:diguanylate cyclase (GGDEF)-like protein
LEAPIEVIVVEPAEADLPLIETVAAVGTFRLTAVVMPQDGPLVRWFEARGVERVDELGAASRLLPGALVAFLGNGLPPADVIDRAASHGLSVIGREVLSRLSLPETTTSSPGHASGDVVGRYRRLLEDYFPTSRSSSTAVKLAACLTEVTSMWQAKGGAILVGRQGSGSLGLVSQRGLDLPRDTVVKIDTASAIGRCFSRDKHEALELAGGDQELLPGIKAASAVCLAIKPGNGSRGVLLIWSESPGAFSRDDIPSLSIFAYYVAMLMEVDDLGDRLGENLITDPLTGLHNRRQFDHRLKQEMLRAQRYTLNLSLAVMDIDNLAEYNKVCGQMLGNLALSDIASILIKCTREVDLVARIGGDEFAALLPETNRLGALKVADRLRSDIASYPFPVPEDGVSANLTISIGIANFPSTKGTEQDLLEKAHRALDLAKKEGPDSIKLWDEKLEKDTPA